MLQIDRCKITTAYYGNTHLTSREPVNNNFHLSESGACVSRVVMPVHISRLFFLPVIQTLMFTRLTCWLIISPLAGAKYCNLFVTLSRYNVHLYWICTDHHFSQANGRIATKLAHDGLQVSVHPGCAQGKGQRSKVTWYGHFCAGRKIASSPRQMTGSRCQVCKLTFLPFQ